MFLLLLGHVSCLFLRLLACSLLRRICDVLIIEGDTEVGNSHQPRPMSVDSGRFPAKPFGMTGTSRKGPCVATSATAAKEVHKIRVGRTNAIPCGMLELLPFDPLRRSVLLLLSAIGFLDVLLNFCHCGFPQFFLVAPDGSSGHGFAAHLRYEDAPRVTMSWS